MERYSAVMSGSPDIEYGRPGKNLLCNGDFRQTVNQRGGAAYTAGGYGPDRWTLDLNGGGLTVSVRDGCIRLQQTAVGVGSGQSISQPIEGVHVYSGELVTLTVEHRGPVPSQFLLTADPVGVLDGSLTILPASETWMTTVRTVRLPVRTAGQIIRPFFYADVSGKLGYTEYRRIKLEVGGRFTGWDTPDFAAELARCERYGERMDGAICVEPLPIDLAVGMVRNGSFKTRKRVIPRIVWTGNIYSPDGVTVLGTGSARHVTRDALLAITFHFPTHAGSLYHIKAEEMFADAEM